MRACVVSPSLNRHTHHLATRVAVHHAVVRRQEVPDVAENVLLQIMKTTNEGELKVNHNKNKVLER